MPSREIEDLLARRLALARDEVHLVVAVQVHLVRLVAELLALQQFCRDVRIARGRDKRREPVHAGHDAVLDLAGLYLARPAQDHRHAEAAFERGALAAGERRLAAVRPGEVLGAVVGREADDRVAFEVVVLQVLHDGADDVVDLRHAGFLHRPVVFRVAQRLVLGRQVRDDVHPRRVQPEEERLVILARLVHELERQVEDLVVDGLHPLRTKFTGVLDLLLADLAPARLNRGVVHGGRPRMHHVARAHRRLQRLWIRRMAVIFHRVQVIEVAEEFVEAVHGGQELVQVAQVILAELAGGVAHRLQRRRDRRCLRRHADRRARLADRREAGADRQLAGDEVGAPRRAACFSVIVGEAHAFGREAVEVGRAHRHDALVVRADIGPADIVAHDHDDVGLLARRLRNRRHRHHQCGREPDNGGRESAKQVHVDLPAMEMFPCATDTIMRRGSNMIRKNRPTVQRKGNDYARKY